MPVRLSCPASVAWEAHAERSGKIRHELDTEKLTNEQRGEMKKSTNSQKS